jgi:hypothetical protein
MLARFLPAPRHQAQRPVLRAHATWPFKDGPKNPKGLGLLIVFSLISVQTNLSLQSSEFLLRKDREIADNVHHGPLSVDFDDG